METLAAGEARLHTEIVWRWDVAIKSQVLKSLQSCPPPFPTVLPIHGGAGCLRISGPFCLYLYLQWESCINNQTLLFVGLWLLDCCGSLQYPAYSSENEGSNIRISIPELATTALTLVSMDWIFLDAGADFLPKLMRLFIFQEQEREWPSRLYSFSFSTSWSPLHLVSPSLSLSLSLYLSLSLVSIPTRFTPDSGAHCPVTFTVNTQACIVLACKNALKLFSYVHKTQKSVETFQVFDVREKRMKQTVKRD